MHRRFSNVSPARFVSSTSSASRPARILPSPFNFFSAASCASAPASKNLLLEPDPKNRPGLAGYVIRYDALRASTEVDEGSQHLTRLAAWKQRSPENQR